MFTHPFRYPSMAWTVLVILAVTIIVSLAYYFWRTRRKV